MPKATKATVRKGRIYQLQVADSVYRAFIWQSGSGFCGRVEEHPEIPHCRGRTVPMVQEQLREALVVSLKC